MSEAEASHTCTIEELIQENARLRQQLEQALAEIERLRRELEKALRSGKRQAAPFSRRRAKTQPQRPGRKPGRSYGQRAQRAAPQVIDEEVTASLPAKCPCGGVPVYHETQAQFQEDIVRRTVRRRFAVEIGYCAACGNRVQGRHPLQTSVAIGAAHVLLGLEALALAAHLNKEMGLSHERAARVLELGFGLRVSRSGLCRAIMRLGEKAAPTYQQLLVVVRGSLVTWLDETGWKVAAHLQWLWVCLSVEVTVYAILPGRGFAQATALLDADYDRWMHHDGWSPYYRYTNAFHQSCLGHLIVRCRHLIEQVTPAAAQFPIAVMHSLQTGLALKARYDQQEISRHGLAVATGRLESAMEALLSRHYRAPTNRRLANHLRHEQPWLFTFLHCPGIDPTNNAAERALRPAVIARKTWGGNRTTAGARVQQILMSVLRTCRQQNKDSFGRVAALLRSPGPMVLDIVPSGNSP